MPDKRRNDPDPEETAVDESDGAPAQQQKAASPGDETAALLKEKEALYDRLLRTAAEFDNYRKRIDRERRELSEFAAADVIAELLPIIDDLERALQAPVGGEPEAFRQGVELILRQMQELLRRRGVKAIDAVGAAFDPNFHQAVTQEVSPGYREGEVIEELRRGYMLGERLLRASMVKVAKAS